MNERHEYQSAYYHKHKKKTTKRCAVCGGELEHGTHCPIKAVSGVYTYDRCLKNTYSCAECVQKWLNEECEK